ncbi:phosphopantetheine-binding protein [Anaerocolumna chitinilytica]|uniref:Carrier domain-containing protein n=1 Tax=Anaerocolumna chitinilytica TaxID=1727145 RepID=A0A7M3SA51_9FIRM|nr:phosphopantetheine-binding protein [Anaerocolumna chitinilytica]BCK01469.1 hypothetical protein bsdcttw_45090 [Anaerocolumna chitinilytica]
MNDIIIKIIDIVNEVTEDTKITEESLEMSFEELGIDSIAFISIIISLEEEFCIEIPDENLLLSELNTVHKIAELLVMLNNN